MAPPTNSSDSDHKSSGDFKDRTTDGAATGAVTAAVVDAEQTHVVTSTKDAAPDADVEAEVAAAAAAAAAGKNDGVLTPAPPPVVDATEAITAEEDARVLRRIDWALMPVVMIIYFLVTLDKASLSYTSVFGIQQDARLVGNQYSLLGSAVYISQLVFQPISAYAIVKFRLSWWVPALIVGWGTVLATGAAAHNFQGLFAMRFFLGALESSIAPCNVALCQSFYKRSEQGFRTANWYAMNGLSTILGSAIAYGLGHIHSDKLFQYQIIFLFLGLITVVYGVTTYFTVPDNIDHAYFLKGDDKRIAKERVRFNQAGTEERRFDWSQLLETILDLKTWLWFLLAFLISIPSGGFSNFQALLIQSFGFDKYQTMLLTMPVGAMQLLSTYLAFYGSMWLGHRKSPVVIIALIPTLTGAAMLYALPRNDNSKGALLAAYYLTVCYIAVTPLLFAWHAANVAGRTKKTVTTALFVAGQAIANVIGPLLFNAADAPTYRPGLRACLAILCALFVLVCFTTLYLFLLNKRNERRRAARGLTGKLQDYSMMSPAQAEKARQKALRAAAATAAAKGQGSESVKEEDASTASPAVQEAAEVAPMHGARAFDDLTDLQNDEFIYVY